MTFFGALGTAVQGITAQAAAIGHISDNVANATNIGYKNVNTRFSDLSFNKVLGESSIVDSNRHMGVLALADFANRKQGTLIRSESTTAISITGNGFFPVRKPSSFESTTEADPQTGETVQYQNPVFGDETIYYTRAGDFRMDSSRRLVNSAGYYLQAVNVPAGQGITFDPTGETPEDFQIDTRPIEPVPTTTINYKLNLPATAEIGKQVNNGIEIYDSTLGNDPHSFQVSWTKNAANSWSFTINTPGSTPASFGPVDVTFGGDGTLDTWATADANLTLPAIVDQFTVGFSVDYGTGPQVITLDMGPTLAFDPTATSQVTQFAGETEEATNFIISQDGLPGGDFEYITFGHDGEILFNYANGRSAVRGHVMLGQFAEPDRLNRIDGTTYVADDQGRSGTVSFNVAGADGAGNISGGTLEQSTVDVAEEMSKLIVAQQAYSMNGQVISAADAMLSRAVDMKR